VNALPSGAPANADYEALIRLAREVADDLLERYYGLRIEKALDLHTRGGFDLAVAQLSAELRRHSSAAEAEALRIALRVLDVDWHRTTAGQRRDLVARSMADAGRATAAVPGQVQAVFGRQADRILAATRRDAREHQHLAISANFNAFDRRIIHHAANSQTLFVTDEYGRRQEEAGRRARDIVARGLEHGLGNDDISRDLQQELEAVLTGRGGSYWDIVASAFTANSRSYGQMSSYAEAGIQRYQISAVLDEATTAICRFMDGKVFSVANALARFEHVERLAAPNDIKAAVPWVREGMDKTSGRRRLYVARGEDEVLVAEVVRSGVGQRDDRGEYASARSEHELSALGVTAPPFHGRCRSSSTPLF